MRAKLLQAFYIAACNLCLQGQLRGLVRQLSIDQFENESRRVSMGAGKAAGCACMSCAAAAQGSDRVPWQILHIQVVKICSTCAAQLPLLYRSHIRGHIWPQQDAAVRAPAIGAGAWRRGLLAGLLVAGRLHSSGSAAAIVGPLDLVLKRCALAFGYALSTTGCLCHFEFSAGHPQGGAARVPQPPPLGALREPRVRLQLRPGGWQGTWEAQCALGFCRRA